MADAYAKGLQAVVGGLTIEEWMNRNYQPHTATLEGDDLIQCVGLKDDSVRMVPRRFCAILLSNAQKWRKNSDLAWYYEPVRLGVAAVPGAESAEAAAPVPVPVPVPEGCITGQLKVVDYREAMLASAGEGLSASEAFCVVPLFRQVSRPTKGSRLAIPLQFAADAVTAGAGGVAYSEDHIAVAYFNVLQTLCHHAGAAPADALPQWLDVVSYLLADFDYYCTNSPEVKAVVEHLRSSETAPDMVQYSLSFILSRRPFTKEERLRTLETMLKRSYKHAEHLLSPDGYQRLLSAVVLIPLLYGMFNGYMKRDSVANHFSRVRSKLQAMVDTVAAAAVALDAAAAAQKDAYYKAKAARTKAKLLRDDDNVDDSDDAASVSSANTAATDASTAKWQRRVFEGSTAVLDREAELIASMCLHTGLVVPQDSVKQLIAFCKERFELSAADIAAEEAAAAAIAAGADAATVSKATSHQSIWTFERPARSNTAHTSVNWRADMPSREEVEAAAAAAVKAEAEKRAAATGGRRSSVSSTGSAHSVSDSVSNWREASAAAAAAAAAAADAASPSYRLGGVGIGIALQGGSSPHSRRASVVSLGAQSLGAQAAGQSGQYGSGGAFGSLSSRRSFGGASPASGGAGGRLSDRFNDAASVGSARSHGSNHSWRSSDAFGLSGNVGSGRTGSSPTTATLASPSAATGGSSTLASLAALSPSATSNRHRPPTPSKPATATSGQPPQAPKVAPQSPASSSASATAAVPPPLLSPSAAAPPVPVGKWVPKHKQGIAAAQALAQPPARRWKVANLGVRADFTLLGLIPPVTLPFMVACGGIFKGELTVTDASSIAAAAVVPAVPTVRPMASKPAVSVDVAEQAALAAAAACEVAYPYDCDCDAADAQGFGIRVVPEYPSLSAYTPTRGSDGVDYVNATVLVSVRAPELAEGSSARPRVSLSSVLDVSGSMGGSKLTSLQAAMRFVVGELRDVDSVSITTFETNGHLLNPMARLTAAARNEVVHTIEALNACGGTDIAAGLQLALEDYATAHAGAHVGDVGAIFLLTDGQDPNNPRIPGLLERCQQLGVNVHTFGFGVDHDAACMSNIAQSTGGSFAYVENAEDVGDAFAACLGGLSSCVTRDMQLRIEVPQGAAFAREGVITAVHTAYKTTVAENGKSVVVSFNNVYAEEKREVLVTLRLPVTAVTGLQAAADCPPLLTAQATYARADKPGVTVNSAVARYRDCSGPAADGAAAGANILVSLASNRELTAKTLKEVLTRAEAGEFLAAGQLLSTAVRSLQDSVSAELPQCRALVDDLEAVRTRTASSESLVRGGRATMLSAISTHSAQRFTAGSGAGTGSAAAYQVASQARILAARMGYKKATGGAGAAGGAGGASAAMRAVDPLRHRSNFSRAMTCEARLEPVLTGTSAGARVSALIAEGMLPAAAAAAAADTVKITGTITTAWSAVQLQQEGKYVVMPKRLGLRADAAPELLLFTETSGAEVDLEAADGAPRTKLVALAAEGGAGSSTASTDVALSSTGDSLAPGLRITCGNVLFGGAPGAFIGQGAGGMVSDAPDYVLPSTEDVMLTWDMNAPLHVTLASDRITVQWAGDVTVPGARGHTVVLPRYPGLPLLLGLLNLVLMVRYEQPASSTLPPISAGLGSSTPPYGPSSP